MLMSLGHVTAVTGKQMNNSQISRLGIQGNHVEVCTPLSQGVCEAEIEECFSEFSEVD